MKKFFAIASVLTVLSVPVFAGPRECPLPFCPGVWNPCPYVPCWGCDRGLANAAAITGIVANGIGMLSNLAEIAHYQNQPTVTVVPAVTPVTTTAVTPVTTAMAVPAATATVTPVTTPVTTQTVTVTVPPSVVTPAVTPVTTVVYGGYTVPVYVNPPTVMPVMTPAGAYRNAW